MRPAIKIAAKRCAGRSAATAVRGSAVRESAVRELTASPLPLAGESEGATYGVVRCANLRRDVTTGNLVAAGLPLCNNRLTSQPLLTLGDGGRIAVVAAGNRLRVQPLDGDTAGYDIGGVTGSVKSIVITAPDRGVVMTDTARYTMMRDSTGKWGLHGSATYPALQFEAVDVMRLSADAGARELTGEYDTHSLTLNDADTDRLGKDLLRCYRDLVDKTVRSGMELQPLLARYRLEGEDGEVLYRSPVVQVGAPSGVQCVDELHCELGADGRSRGVLRVAADVYRLRLRQTGTNLVEPGTVRRLVVETTLPVHPVDPDVIAANALGRIDTNSVRLRCFLPGASVTMTPSRRRPSQQLRAMALKGDAAFHEALTVYNPFDGDAPLDVAVEVSRGGVQGVDGEIEAVRKVLDTDVNCLPAMVARCRVPNTFVAATGCRAGDNVVWGGISAIPFAGYRIEEFVAETTPAGEVCPWRAVVVTELASGSRCVATSWGQTHAPVRLSPVLAAARADVVSMTVIIERDGLTYKGVYPMTPDETGVASYYYDESGERIEPEAVDEAFAYVSDNRVAEHFPSGLLVAGVSNPYDPGRGDTAGRGKVVTAAVVDRRGSAWEFGRHRVYAFTDDGIYLLSVASGIDGLRCNRLDRRGVATAAGVTETDDDRYPVVCIAGGDIVGLSRGNAVTLEERVAENAVGWDAVNKELWLVGTEGTARVKESLDGGGHEVAGLSVAGFRDGVSGLLVDSDSGIRDTALGEEPVSETAYTLRCDMPALDWYRAGMRICGAGAQLRSPDVNGVMRVVSRDIDARHVRATSEIEFSGEVNTPLTMGLYGFTGPVIDVTVAGEMAAGSHLREIRLIAGNLPHNSSLPLCQNPVKP